MELLGGVLIHGELRKDCGFRPVTGTLELAIVEVGSSDASWPVRVTNALHAALEHLAGQSPSWDMVHGMSVGDRQYLVRQLAAHLGHDESWLTAHCESCDEPFDFFVQESRLPAKPAGSSYPFADADTTLGRIRARVPTGADQAVLAELSNARPLATHESLGSLLARRLLVEPDDLPTGDLSEQDVTAIEAALEEIAPEVATQAQIPCPGCHATNRIALDPYSCLTLGRDDLFADVHLLAGYYHWQESEILAMPRTRRQVYIRLVDRARGMVQ